jgi:hypothetical protein
MIIVSHRGNLYGPDHSVENTPDQIELVISKGIDVEIDVRLVDGVWFLGHDFPQYKIEESFLKQNESHLWCHAKNIEALEKLRDIGMHCFWHDQDKYTLTSKGIIWAYPNYYTSSGILVLPDKTFMRTYRYTHKIHGVCVDDINI